MNKIKTSLCNPFKIILNNFKTELFILLLSIAFFIFGTLVYNSNVDVRTVLDNLTSVIFLNDRLNMIATILTITTGFYLTIATVVAVSVINVSKAILESQSDKPIITLIMLGVVENIACIILCTLLISKNDCDTKNIFISFLLLVVILLSLGTFTKFINFVRHLLIENMKQMQIDIKVNNRKEEELIEIFEKIEKNTRIK